MTKATAAKMQYIADYEAEKYDKVLIRFPRGTKERIQATGATVNGFTVAAVLGALDSTQAPPDQTIDE